MSKPSRQMPARGLQVAADIAGHERTGLDTVLVAKVVASPRGACHALDASATIDELLSRASVTIWLLFHHSLTLSSSRSRES